MITAIRVVGTLAGLFLLLSGGFLFYAIPGDDKFVPFCLTMAGMVGVVAMMLLEE